MEVAIANLFFRPLIVKMNQNPQLICIASIGFTLGLMVVTMILSIIYDDAPSELDPLDGPSPIPVKEKKSHPAKASEQVEASPKEKEKPKTEEKPKAEVTEKSEEKPTAEEDTKPKEKKKKPAK